MEREYIDEDEPPPSVELISEAPVESGEDRLERLLRGVVHTILATYRLDGKRRLQRRSRTGRLGRKSSCALDLSNT